MDRELICLEEANAELISQHSAIEKENAELKVLNQEYHKSSPYWSIDNYDDLQVLVEKFDTHYREKYGYDIFKGCSLEQILKQAEIDAVGIAFSESAQSIYAVDIAYHGAGINYGDKEKTLSKIILKCIRTVLCLYGCFNMASGMLSIF